MISDLYYNVVLYIAASMRIAISLKNPPFTPLPNTHYINKFLLKALMLEGVKYV
jgi:hypothetical protein